MPGRMVTPVCICDPVCTWNFAFNFPSSQEQSFRFCLPSSPAKFWIPSPIIPSQILDSISSWPPAKFWIPYPITHTPAKSQVPFSLRPFWLGGGGETHQTSLPQAAAFPETAPPGGGGKEANREGREERTACQAGENGIHFFRIRDVFITKFCREEQ